MLLPNAERSEIDQKKLQTYLLSPTHPVGRFKARFFAALGYSSDHWLTFEADLRLQHLTQHAVAGPESAFGQPFTIRAILARPRHAMVLRLRPARPDDAAALAELAARTFHDTFASDNTPEDMAAHAAESYGPEIQGREIAEQNIRTVLLDVDHELVGFSQLRRGPAPACVTGPSPIEVWRFYVAKAHHGTLAAPALMTRAVADARAMGARTLWLGVWERNERAPSVT